VRGWDAPPAAVAPVEGRWRLERALHECRRCAAELGSLGAIYGQSVVLMYLAIAAMHLGLYEEARDACIRSCELARQASTMIRDAWPTLFLARAYLRLGQPETALKVLEPVRSASDRAALQMLPVVVAEVQVKLGNYAAAEAEVMRAYRGASPRLQRVAAGVLARAQLARGATSDALTTLELATQSPTSSGLESEVELMNLHAECLLLCEQRDAARRVAKRTRERVLELAADIVDPTLRQSFLQRVEPCARALALHEQLS
jgi:ATP/maltotriose-dependent transcriptional regulator MalT